MNKGISDNAQRNAFVGRPSVFDVGIGVLYFFASHMVIRTMYYVGLDRDVWELSLFFLIVVGFALLAHACAPFLLRLRWIVESTVGVPAVSAVAAAGALLALVSSLPVVGVGLFYISGGFLGFACGWMIVIWVSTTHTEKLDVDSFFVDPSLVVATAVYFLFRVVSTFSDVVAQGFLLALPLMSIACIVQGGRGDLQDDATIFGERAQALQVLVVVAASFAVGCSVMVSLSGSEGETLSSGLNYMVLFEVLAVALMLCCCGFMGSFARRGPSLQPVVATAFSFFVCCVPMFLVGVFMGSSGIPETSPDALWESNVWVLIIAIFAYDIREVPYAVKGLAVGIMFESMCLGQLVARISLLLPIAHAPLLAVILTVLYFASMARQFFSLRGFSKDCIEYGDALAVGEVAPGSKKGGDDCGEEDSAEDLKEPWDENLKAEALSLHSSRSFNEADSIEGDVPSGIMTYCRGLASKWGLTPREAEILAFIALGRSAKYIAEELGISYNTARTHIRHVYEKLNIHSKQELIDLVLFGSGVM